MPVYPGAVKTTTVTFSGNFIIDMMKGPLKGYTIEGDYTGKKAYTLPEDASVFAVRDFYEKELSESGWKQLADFPTDEFLYPFVEPFQCFAYKTRNQIFLICFPSKPPYGEYWVYLFESVA